MIVHGGPVFDGSMLHWNTAAHFKDGYFHGCIKDFELNEFEHTVDLYGDILIPGYVDLQVNGGGGILFNEDPSVDGLTKIAVAHRRLGAASILPTLISDSPAITQSAIDATIAAVAAAVPGIAGLHLEGPHLSFAKKGAHDAKFIRPMTDNDLHQLLNAKQQLPLLKVTVAPENVSTDDVSILAQAGVLVSLGHTDAGFDLCREYIDAGARCVTHLFNAMSQFNSREPGLVGATLNSTEVYAGLIADGHHVHPESMRLAFNTNTRVQKLFLVSDAMAVAGTDQSEFLLNDRRISRSEGRLTLDDGTLAGADLQLTHAIKTLVEQSDVPLETALQAAITVPAELINMSVSLVPSVTTLSSLYRLSVSLDTIDAFELGHEST